MERLWNWSCKCSGENAQEDHRGEHHCSGSKVRGTEVASQLAPQLAPSLKQIRLGICISNYDSPFLTENMVKHMGRRWLAPHATIKLLSEVFSAIDILEGTLARGSRSLRCAAIIAVHWSLGDRPL